jgi:sigma-B regulation protein RsbU (phosphoserine phosphatase)
MTLSVKNEGDPIPAELVAKVFEPMVRGAPGGTSARSVGLGLYIVKEIARGHGGEMELLSSREEGTRVIFRFSNSLGS